MRGRPQIYIKLVVTVLVCGVILWNCNWDEIVKGIRQLDVLKTLLVFILVVLSVPISTYKWKLLLEIHQIHFSFRSLHDYYFIGMFFNNFIPGSIGGDAYRIYKTMNKSESRACAALAVIAERISGLGALLLMVYVGGFIGFYRADEPIATGVTILGTVGLVILIIGLKLLPDLWTRFHKLVPYRYSEIIKGAIEHLGDYRMNPQKSSKVVVLSFLFHIHSLVFYSIMLDAAGVSCDWYNLIMVMGLTTLAGILPLSFNGVGIMEGTFMYTLGHYGIGNEIALLVILAFRAMLLMVSLIGGILYMMSLREDGSEETSNQKVAIEKNV